MADESFAMRAAKTVGLILAAVVLLIMPAVLVYVFSESMRKNIAAIIGYEETKTNAEICAEVDIRAAATPEDKEQACVSKGCVHTPGDASGEEKCSPNEEKVAEDMGKETVEEYLKLHRIHPKDNNFKLAPAGITIVVILSVITVFGFFTSTTCCNLGIVSKNALKCSKFSFDMLSINSSNSLSEISTLL